MDILELGAAGELVGGVAVVASLVYVGLQIRHNTAATRKYIESFIEEPSNAARRS